MFRKKKNLTYREQVIGCLNSVNPNEFDGVFWTLADAVRDNGKVFICGNGGSHLTACHFAEDAMKGLFEKANTESRFLALGTNPGLQMAIANDIGYDQIFSFEGNRLFLPGDVVIGLSVSGNSENVRQALVAAKAHDCRTIAFLGFDGRGKIAEYADQIISIDSEHFGVVEDVHMSLLHELAYRLPKVFGGK